MSRAAQEMVRRAHANGDIYLGTYEGWYCPNEGFRNASDVLETPRGTICPNHPDVPLQWLTERNWFFRLSAYQERLERHFADHPDFVQPDFRRNEMLGFIRGGLEDFSISRERTPGDWGIPFPIAENGETALREDGSWDPEAGKIYVWFDALINYITGAGFPDDPDGVRATGGLPTCTSSARTSSASTRSSGRRCCGAPGSRPPRHVWVHGFLIAAGGERMSKSRGNFLDPNDFVVDVRLGRRPLRRPARGAVRPRRGGVVGLVRAALQRGPRQRLREPRQPDRVDDQPLPRRGAAGAARVGRVAARGMTGSTRCESYRERLESCLLHDALAELWEYVGNANKVVDAEQPWVLAKAWKAGDEAAGERLRGVLGDLVEACRLVGLAAAPFLPGTAPRLLAQLGHAYPYGPDGNGGPPILDELAWGAHAAEAGRVTAPEPLFPRLDVESDDVLSAR